MRKLLMVLACVVGVFLLLVSLAAAPAASPTASAAASSPAAVRLLTAEEVAAALLVADSLEQRFKLARLDRGHWLMPVKAPGVPICNDWAVEVGGTLHERFFAGARSVSPTRFAGRGRQFWTTKKDHHLVVGLVFGSAAEAAAAWEEIKAAVAACPGTLREKALPDGTRLTSRRNSPVSNVQTWTPEAESWWGSWQWLRVREQAKFQGVLSGRDSAQRAVHDYALRGNVILAQLRREWGRPDAAWRGLDGRARDTFGPILRRLDSTPCGPEGCVAP